MEGASLISTKAKYSRTFADEAKCSRIIKVQLTARELFREKLSAHEVLHTSRGRLSPREPFRTKLSAREVVSVAKCSRTCSDKAKCSRPVPVPCCFDHRPTRLVWEPIPAIPGTRRKTRKEQADPCRVVKVENRHLLAPHLHRRSSTQPITCGREVKRGQLI